MDFLVESEMQKISREQQKKGEIVSVRKLITLLLEHKMSHQVIIKDKNGNELHDVQICVREQEVELGCLFG